MDLLAIKAAGYEVKEELKNSLISQQRNSHLKSCSVSLTANNPLR